MMKKTKICTRCSKEKVLAEFNKRWYEKYQKYYINSWCKKCHGVYRRAYMKIYKQTKKYKDYHAAYIKFYSKTDKSKNRQAAYLKSSEGKITRALYHKKKLKEDINYKLRKNLRGRLLYALKYNRKTNSAI